MNVYSESSDAWGRVFVDKGNTCIQLAHDYHAPIHRLVERSQGDDRTTKEERQVVSEFLHPEPFEVKKDFFMPNRTKLCIFYY